VEGEDGRKERSIPGEARFLGSKREEVALLERLILQGANPSTERKAEGVVVGIKPHSTRK
jgi:hypothetical protein